GGRPVVRMLRGGLRGGRLRGGRGGRLGRPAGGGRGDRRGRRGGRLRRRPGHGGGRRLPAAFRERHRPDVHHGRGGRPGGRQGGGRRGGVRLGGPPHEDHGVEAILARAALD